MMGIPLRGQRSCANGFGDVVSLCENGLMFNDATELLSPAEVARRLGVHRGSVYRWIGDGELPALRLGQDGPLRVRGDALEEWLQQHPAAPREEITHG